MTSARLRGSPPDRRRGMQEPRQLDRGARLRELGADGRRQVLDVGDLHQARLGRRLHPDRLTAERALDPPDHDLVLATVLRGAQELLAEVIVDRGVGAAPSGAGQRHRRRARPGAPHEQLRAGAEERRLGRAAAKAEAGREQLPKRAVDGRRLVRPGRFDHHLPRQHHLLELAGPDPAHRLRHTAPRSAPEAARSRSGSRPSDGDRQAAATASPSAASRAPESPRGGARVHPVSGQRA